MCHQSWTDFPQVLMTMILNAKDSGKQHLQLISKAISMVRDAKTKPFLYEVS